MSPTSCRSCKESFVITDEDRAFLKNLVPVIGGKKFELPEPTLCPDCRQQRRLLYRNERVLYPRTCSATGKKFISPLSPDKPFPVYENEYWYGDAWDAKQYGRAFDFSRPFFPQFQELLHAVPQLGRSCAALQNCEYVNQCGWSKDCYLIFDADNDESCFYSNNLWGSKCCMDMLQSLDCQFCYECIDCVRCYGVKWSKECENCSGSSFLRGCIGCQECTACVNLRNKRHCLFNEQLSEEEYKRRVAALHLQTRSGVQAFRQTFQEFAITFPVKMLVGAQNEDSLGDGLWQTQRCHHCFDVSTSQDCRYVYQARNMKNVMDLMNFGAESGVQNCYECHELGDGVQSVCFCDQVWTNCNDLLYCKLCVNGCHHCFGCVGLKHASYCVFNIQVTKEEYEELVPRIIEHMRKDGAAMNRSQATGSWGEFFPASIAYYGYNETLAQEYYPLTSEEARSKGYSWKEDIDQPPQVKKTVPGSSLPEEIGDVPDDILDWAVTCEISARPFRIVRQELEFYRTHRLPLPAVHPDERHRRRITKRNPRKLSERSCAKCAVTIQTTYDPKCPEIVYCENCFQGAVS